MSARLAALLTTLAIAGIGCSKRYEHAAVGVDSPQGRAVQQMVDELRNAGEASLPDLLDRQTAPDLQPQTRLAVKDSLARLAKASSAQLTRLDAFGDSLLVASFEWQEDSGTHECSLLLVEKNQTLYWAGL